MPKNQIIDPNESRKKSEITFSPIPVNQYSPNIKNEVKELGYKRIIKIYKDMLFIREFETMLNLIKTQGEYESIAYNHLGPAHLSIGQEAAAVGQSVHLTPEDFIFGSHRSHGEILAKCFSAISLFNEKNLLKTMEDFLDGDIIRAFNVDESLSYKKNVLWTYVHQGGNLLIQYNTSRGLKTKTITPYSIELSRDRITDENSKVKMLDSKHPLLNYPNKISLEIDFEIKYVWTPKKNIPTIPLIKLINFAP